MIHCLSRSPLFVVSLLLTPTLCQAQVKPSGDAEIISAGAQLELVFDGASVLTEGVASAPDGTMYFSDITFTHLSKDQHGVSEAGHIWKYDPRSKQTAVFRSPSGMSNGIKFDAAGSDPRYLGHEPLDHPLASVYRIDTDGSIHRIIIDAGKPNGVCVSPDQKSLYVVSNDNGSTAHLEGVGLPPRAPPIAPARPHPQPELDFAA